jgi:chemotaxis regulatin CheY-phosphate phosphatase CheZ
LFPDFALSAQTVDFQDLIQIIILVLFEIVQAVLLFLKKLLIKLHLTAKDVSMALQCLRELGRVLNLAHFHIFAISSELKDVLECLELRQLLFFNLL